MGKSSGLAALAQGRVDVLKIDPDLIREQPDWNVRDEADPEFQEHVESLAASIAEVGVKEPLKVFYKDGEVWLTNGHCRLAAVRLLKERGVEIKSVPVMAEDRYGNDADRTLTMLVSNSGKPLKPLEQARVLKRLIDYGWGENEIAAKIGKTATRVKQLLELNTAPAAVTAMVSKGEVSATMAMNAVREHGDEAAPVLEQAVETAKARGKTKATPKDVDKPRTNYRDLFEELMSYLEDESILIDGRKVHIFNVPEDRWEVMRG